MGAALFLLLYACVYFCKPCPMSTTKHVISIQHREADPLYPFYSPVSPLVTTALLSVSIHLLENVLQGATARRSNQSILKEISPEYSLEGLMLKLKLQCFGHLMRRTDSFEKTLRLGKIEGRRRRGWQRMRWLDAITDPMGVWASSKCWWWTGKPDVLQSMGSQRVGHDWPTELNWIFTKTAGLQIIPAFKEFLGLSNKK